MVITSEFKHLMFSFQQHLESFTFTSIIFSLSHLEVRKFNCIQLLTDLVFDLILSLCFEFPLIKLNAEYLELL